MKRYCVVHIVLFVIVFSVNLIHCRRDLEDTYYTKPQQKSNFTYLERLTALTQCLERQNYPLETIEALQNLFKEFKGKTDVMYLIRAAEFIGEDYVRGTTCVCRGIYSSADRGIAKHCFSSDDEWGLITELCLRKSSNMAAKFLPKTCGVPSLKDLRDCCKYPERMA